MANCIQLVERRQIAAVSGVDDQIGTSRGGSATARDSVCVSEITPMRTGLPPSVGSDPGARPIEL
jgi:hypothetical protein